METAVNWIEFTGEVGAGKTTLAAAFRRCVESQGFRALTPDEAVRLAMERTLPGSWLARILPAHFRGRALQKLYRWCAAPLAWTAFARQRRELVHKVKESERARRTLASGHRRIIRSLFSDIAALYQFALPRLRPGEFVVLDEGFTHRAVNLFAWEPGEVDADAVRAYISHLPETGLVVMVSAPGSTALERAEARGLPVRLRDKNPEVIHRFITHTGQITRITTDQLANQASQWRRVVTVENNNTPETVAEGLEQIVNGLVSLHRNPAAVPIFTSRPFIRLPRPDRLLTRLRFQRQTPNAMEQDPNTLLSAWNLCATGPVQRASGPGRSGSWLIPTNSGLKVLKRYKSALDRNWVIHEHSILQELAAAGFPAPRLVPAKNGTLLQRDGGIFALFEAYEGYFHYHNSLFLPGMAQQFVKAGGKTMAAMHLALQGFTPQGCNPNGFIDRSKGRWRELDWYLSRLERCAAAPLAVFDDAVSNSRSGHPVTAAWLRERLEALDKTLKDAHLERVIIHGDYGPYNLLFRQGSPVVVLDFELARLDWRLTDLSTGLFFFTRGRTGFRWKDVHSFLDAYRSVTKVGAVEMEHLPLVWQFLTLRRIIVLWERSLENDRRALKEVRERLDLLDWLEQHEKDLRSL
jgi:homoserine kinase type II